MYSYRVHGTRNQTDLWNLIETSRHKMTYSKRKREKAIAKCAFPCPRLQVKLLVPRRMPISGPTKWINASSIEYREIPSISPKRPMNLHWKLIFHKNCTRKLSLRQKAETSKTYIRNDRSGFAEKPTIRESLRIWGSLRTGGKLHYWHKHIKQHRKKNPKLSFKDTLKSVKKAYRKKKSGFGGK